MSVSHDGGITGSGLSEPDDLRDADPAPDTAISHHGLAVRPWAREEPVIKAEYWDPGTGTAVTAWISGEGELPGLLDAIVMIRGGRARGSR